MKKIVWFTLLAFVLSAIAGLSLAAAEHNHEHPMFGGNCPVCDLPGIWTGQTKTEWGHLFNLYKCVNGHYWWQREN